MVLWPPHLEGKSVQWCSFYSVMFIKNSPYASKCSGIEDTAINSMNAALVELTFYEDMLALNSKHT